jgi:hypothetical protein
MGGPKLTPEEMEKRQKEKQRKSLLFKRIKQLFTNKEVKELLGHLGYLPTEISSYFVANISNLVRWLYDDNDIDPINMSNEEFKRKIIEDVTINIDDEV